MPRESKATEQLRATIRRFIKSQAKREPRTAADRALYFATVKEPDMVRAWALSEVERFIQIEDQKAAEPNPDPEEKAQLEFLGDDFQALFNGPRHSLLVKGGIRRQLRMMTVTQLRQAAVAIRARISPRASQQAAYLERLADEMSPYARLHPRLKFGDYLELRTAGITV